MPFSRTVKDQCLNLFRGINATGYTTVYAALLTSQPTDDTGTGLVEISTSAWTNYARIATGTMSAPSGTSGTRSIANSGTVDFGTATVTGSAISLTGCAFYDAPTSGTFLGYGTVPLVGGNPPQVANGNNPIFSAGQLVISEA